ncbi:MAG TPA: Zn-binding domain-containing protein, partial [Thermomicrobiales bacterium]|nr:Zn-binding domain-containing protein [Thermomicrobiales bacterium]
DGERPTLALLPSVRDGLANPHARERARVRAARVLATIADDLQSATWHTEGWLDGVLAHVVDAFDAAAERWRSHYRAASNQRDLQNRVIGDASRAVADKERARRLRRDAESQLDLLLESGNVLQSDFYPYRYFASEGFLPGYSFPRLPLSAFIPARRRQARDEFLQRPRFLAISEFGPRAIVYHEGSRYRINKVILPVRDEEELPTASVKQCAACGYLHPLEDGPGPDLCERCAAPLDAPLTRLFRLQHVAATRQDRINSDEEERQRLGYELRTGVRFAARQDRPDYRRATAARDGEPLAELTYGDAATLWRINLGWTRRKNKQQYGFLLDTERGYWARNPDAVDEDRDDPLSARTARVVPYVEDRRNCLLLEPRAPLSLAACASLLAALKHAIQIHYQLEDNELAAEPLPDGRAPRLLFFYESAEGGAGVLRRLVDDPGALPAVAAEALRLCHFDPATGADLHHADGRAEECVAACYDCLMSYGNQANHPLLDRHAIRDTLLALASAQVATSPGERPRAEHLAALRRQAASTLELAWLDFLEAHGYALPARAQVLVADCGTRPDFVYDGDARAAIYVDGPFHDYPERQSRDRQQADCLEDSGYEVLRFGARDDWDALVARHAYVFRR